MKYTTVVPAKFIDRPNRFIAHVDINGKVETVHVKNTGRCKELLLPGAEVYLARSDKPERKTKYDLIAVRKYTGVLFNIDSQAPNQVVREWLAKQAYTKVVPEYRYGDSRVDFYMEKDDEHYLMEVKGCTLEVDGIGYFPDAAWREAPARANPGKARRIPYIHRVRHPDGWRCRSASKRNNTPGIRFGI